MRIRTAFLRQRWLLSFGHAAVATFLAAMLAVGVVPASAQEAAAQPAPEDSTTETSDSAAAAAIADLKGVAVDEHDQPLADVHVQLWFTTISEGESRLIAEKATGADGAFAFADVPLPPSDGRLKEDGIRILTAKKDGRASRFVILFRPWTEDWKMRLTPAATLTGRITDTNGAPVKGAVVAAYVDDFLKRLPGDVRTATSDENGRYAIDDLPAWDATGLKGTKVGENIFAGPERRRLLVTHPDFALARVAYRKAPGEQDAELEPGAAIEGQVVDRVTGKPVADLLVQAAMVIQRTDRYVHLPREGDETRTDANGQYRLQSLPAGTYNVFAHPDREERAAAAIDSLVAEGGETTQAPTIELVEGGWLEGRLLDAATREPLTHIARDGHRFPADIRIYGPDRPQTGTLALAISPPDPDGSFRMRVAPGKQFVRFSSSDLDERRFPRERFEEGIEVAEGEVVRFDMLLLPKEAANYDAGKIVRDKVPLSAERDAARSVRALGGEYEVAEDGHVRVVNVANVKEGTFDEFFERLPALADLRVLLLSGGQVTDARMETVLTLKSLERLLLYEPQELSLPSVQRLQELPRLREVHISEAGLDDEALKVLATLPGIEGLSLQGNAFTDAGVAQLKNAKSLRRLYLGLPQGGSVTDASMPTIGALSQLEALDLQNLNLSDEGLQHLAGLSNLKSLTLRGRFSDAVAETLLKLRSLERLSGGRIDLTEESLRRLSELPNLKEARISSEKFSPRFLKEFQGSSVFELSNPTIPLWEAEF